MHVDIGLIGGTGIGDRFAKFGGKLLHIPTPCGILRGNLVVLGGRSVLLMRRHSNGHKVPPHKVNYAAMSLGLKAVGATCCFATAAVGSLREDWPGGTKVVCDEFVDLSFRNPTLFNRTVVHTDFSNPFGTRTSAALITAANSLKIEVETGGTYVCGNGPRYETPAEIKAYKALGGDIVGMTAATEAILMREVGIDYGCLAVVTNLASGISLTSLSHEEVVEEMERSGATSVRLLEKAIEIVELGK